jgi:hypothetical protein
MSHRKLTGALLTFLSCLLLAGCSTTGPKVDVAAARSQSDFRLIAGTYLTDGKPSYDRQDLQKVLAAGKAFHDAGMWQLSFDAFDIADRLMPWPRSGINSPDDVIDALSNIGKYPGKIYEGSMIEYYQTINAVMLRASAKDPAEKRARAELIPTYMERLAKRQDNAEALLADYGKKAAAAKSRGVSEDKNNSGESLSSARHSAAIALAELPADMRTGDIRHPSGDLLWAFLAMSLPDPDSSYVEYHLNKGALNASGEGKLVFNEINAALRKGSANFRNKVLVIYEDGVGPSLTEFRVDFPMFLFSERLLYTGLALPKFNRGSAAFPGLQVGNARQPTVTFTDFNRIAGLEFKAGHDAVVTAAVLKAVALSAAQYAANKAIDEQNRKKAEAARQRAQAEWPQRQRQLQQQIANAQQQLQQNNAARQQLEQQAGALSRDRSPQAQNSLRQVQAQLNDIRSRQGSLQNTINSAQRSLAAGPGNGGGVSTGNALAAVVAKAAVAGTQYALTKADVRYWDNLPNSVQAVIVDRPGDGVLNLNYLNGQPLAQVRLDTPANYVVLVKASGNRGRPAIYSAAVY